MEIGKVQDIGIKGAIIIFLLTLSYKCYRARVETETSATCCKSCTSVVRTYNNGNNRIAPNIV